MEVIHCITGSTGQSHREHLQYATGRGRRALALPGNVLFHASAKKGDECLPDGADGQEGRGQSATPVSASKSVQQCCDLQLPMPASSSDCSYSNHSNASHELQLPIHCQLHPKLMPPKLPRICTLKPREQPQLLLFILALLDAN